MPGTKKHKKMRTKKIPQTTPQADNNGGYDKQGEKNPQTDPEKNPQIFLHPLSIRGVTRFNLLLEYKLPQFDNPRAGLTLLQKVLR
jgi:hypothetical protein